VISGEYLHYNSKTGTLGKEHVRVAHAGAQSAHGVQLIMTTDHGRSRRIEQHLGELTLFFLFDFLVELFPEKL
jgi:hypothetical protein